MKRILVTDGAYKQTLGIVRNLSTKGYIVDCVGSDYCLSRFSNHLGKVAYLENKFNQDNFLDFVEYIKDINYEVIIPVGAKSCLMQTVFQLVI